MVSKSSDFLFEILLIKRSKYHSEKWAMNDPIKWNPVALFDA